MGTANEGRAVGFVDYAMGGALAAGRDEWPTSSANTDWMSYVTTFYALSFLDDQVKQHLHELRSPTGPENFSGATLHNLYRTK